MSFSARPIGAAMMALALIVLGTIAAVRIPVIVSKAAVLPGVTVEVEYPGVSPEKIEELVTRPVEDAVSTTGAVQEIFAESEEGKARVHVRFDPGTSVEFKMLEIRERLDIVSALFPREVQKPRILKYDPDQRPVMIILLRTKHRTLEDLREIADRELKKLIGSAPGVSQAVVAGGRDREVLVSCDRHRLEAYGLSMRDVLASLQRANLSEGIGRMREGSMELPLRINARLANVAALGDTPVFVGERGTLVRLKDIGRVEFALKEKSLESRYNGAESVTIYVYKSGTADLLELSGSVKDILDAYQRTDLSFEIVQDQARTFRETFLSIAVATAAGACLTLFFIPVFVRHCWRGILALSAWGGAVYLSILVLFVAGRELDLNVLLTLPLTCWLSLLLAAFPPHIFTAWRVTLLTLAVIIPVTAVAEFRQIYASVCVFLVVTISAFAFLFTSAQFVAAKPAVVRQNRRLFVVRARFFRTARLRIQHLHFRQSLEAAALSARTRLNELMSAVRRALLPELRFAFAMAILLTIAVVILWRLPKDLSPAMEAGEVQARIELPSGTGFEETDRIAREVEKRMEASGFFTTIASRVEPAQATLTLKLGPFARQPAGMIDTLKVATTGLDPAFVHFSSDAPGTALQELTIDVFGSDLGDLDKITKELAGKVRTLEGAGDVVLRYKGPRPEVVLVIDKAKAEQSGLSTRDIGELVRYAIQGGVATKLLTHSREFDVRIRYAGGAQSSQAEINEIGVLRADGKFVPLKEVAHQVETMVPVKIYRKNKKRAFSFSVRPAGISSAALVSRLQSLQSTPLPEGYRILFGKELAEIAARQGQFARLGFLTALALFMLTAAVTENLGRGLKYIRDCLVLLPGPSTVFWLLGLHVPLILLLIWILGACLIAWRLTGEMAPREGFGARLTLVFFAVSVVMPGPIGGILRLVALGQGILFAWAFVLSVTGLTSRGYEHERVSL